LRAAGRRVEPGRTETFPQDGASVLAATAANQFLASFDRNLPKGFGRSRSAVNVEDSGTFRSRRGAQPAPGRLEVLGPDRIGARRWCESHRWDIRFLDVYKVRPGGKRMH